jgi:hypothetical protein
MNGSSQRIPNEYHGSRRIHTDQDKSRHIPMDPDGSRQIPTDPDGSRRIPTDLPTDPTDPDGSHGSRRIPRIPTDPDGSHRSHGSRRIPRIPMDTTDTDGSPDLKRSRRINAFNQRLTKPNIYTDCSDHRVRVEGQRRILHSVGERRFVPPPSGVVAGGKLHRRDEVCAGTVDRRTV